MTRKYICTHEPDPIQALREIAPEWARWFCVDACGIGWMQAERGDPIDSDYWESSDLWQSLNLGSAKPFPSGSKAAIHLPTGAVHLQSADGTVIEVTRAEWEKMP